MQKTLKTQFFYSPSLFCALCLSGKGDFCWSSMLRHCGFTPGQHSYELQRNFSIASPFRTAWFATNLYLNYNGPRELTISRGPLLRPLHRLLETLTSKYDKNKKQWLNTTTTGIGVWYNNKQRIYTYPKAYVTLSPVSSSSLKNPLPDSFDLYIPVQKSKGLLDGAL